jgi:formylglycine-generating enzyme required for sulfatase activity
VTWKDAQTYCAWRGRRLPTEAEWEKAARGDDARLFPWGNQWDAKRVRLSGEDARNGDMAAVGSFPQNASPYGALDMSGNAWEWTSSRGMAYPYAAGDGREVQSIAGKRVVRGGAWGTSERNARTTTRDGQEPDNTFWNRGFRCAADVGPTDNSLVIGLAQPPEGMVAVPAGLLRMGTSQAEGQRWASEYGWPLPVNELPQHSVTLAPFFLDRSEVTNERYAAFVEATGRQPPTNSFNPSELNVWKEGRYPPELAQHPVVNVGWEDARAYCAWADKRLPTEAEWEWAAKGPESWLWPWGATFDQTRLNTKERGLGTTALVGSDPANASWIGALDLGGNVWEWTSSLGLPYPYDQADGRENPQRPGARVIRGGSWIDAASSAHTSGRNQFDPALTNVNVGFRCAK